MALIRFILFIFLTILLNGCSTKNIDRKFSLADQSMEGLVIGSISYEGNHAGYTIYYTGDSGKKGWIQIGEGVGFIPIPPKSEFNDNRTVGKLIAISLPIGTYEINRWGVANGSGHLSSTAPFSVRFTVKKGEAVYIGSFAFVQTKKFGLSVTGARLDYRDVADRDLMVFKHKHPNLNQIPLTQIIQPGTNIIGLGGYSESSLTMPIFIPVLPKR